ncbi:unnamed protein product [Rhizoctonia solani]|uniref:O-methylsterigmatocystin oxidoreductase n=1 Tax=Rhizoctonia solani TaxID=456999 RepID=A0A8H3H1C8_9AGAM|nr:unnamed protein product [Rhizoctonia solani]
MLAIPSGLEHLAYLKLGKELNSDIIFIELVGNQIVVLNSAQAASDLMEKRSAHYSARACPPILKDPKMFDWSTNPGLMYNDFDELQEQQTRLMLLRLLNVSKDPQPFGSVKDEFYCTMAASMLHLTYGYHMKDKNDIFYVEMMETIFNKFKAVMYTNFYVNLLPSLIHVPDWFPGAGWKRTVREWRYRKDRAISIPFEWTQDQVNAGVAESSIIGTLLQEHSLTSGLATEEKHHRLKELGMSIFTGGADAAANVLVNFVAAMVMNPHVHAKAQQEIDEVIGSDKLPTLADESRLPYVNNIILELLRWRPISPTGMIHRSLMPIYGTDQIIAIPHACTQDNVYRGYDILEGTIIIGNIWAMTRDEEVYPNPEEFNPDRFLDPKTPPAPVFGWGRRKCPGMHYGQRSMFIAVTSLLSMYTFAKKLDADGIAIEPVLEDAPNTLALEFEPFQFEFKSRSEKRWLLLQSSG